MLYILYILETTVDHQWLEWAAEVLHPQSQFERILCQPPINTHSINQPSFHRHYSTSLANYWELNDWKTKNICQHTSKEPAVQ